MEIHQNIHLSREALCSTPYGIRGKSIFLALLSQPQSSRAQRLTASEVKAYTLSDEEISMIIPCSTPYGIRGKSIAVRGKEGEKEIVGAQRLTASEVKA